MLAYNIVETFVYIINYISKTENVLWTAVLWLFLADEFSTGYTIIPIRFTSCFHGVFVDMFENESKSVNILILLFYICPP